MWTPCSVVLDAPISKWGFELDDLIFLAMTAIALPVLASFVWDMTLVVGVGIVGLWLSLAAILYWGKRGKPAGYLFHLLHSWQLLPFPGLRLPGFLPPGPQLYSPY